MTADRIVKPDSQRPAWWEIAEPLAYAAGRNSAFPFEVDIRLAYAIVGSRRRELSYSRHDKLIGAANRYGVTASKVE